MNPGDPFEFYETPGAFTRWLFREMAHRGSPIVGRIFEPCVGDGEIIKAAMLRPMEFGVESTWRTNDLDPRWAMLTNGRWQHTSLLVDHSVENAATCEQIWTESEIDWTVSNPPFTPAIEIITHAIRHSRVGVAMHLRASIHEVLKTGVRRTWMAEHQPTGILWLPRFAYQRSRTTGKWTTDSVCACWVIWLQPSLAVQCGPGMPHYGQSFQKPEPQFIGYAPGSVIDELAAYTPAYRARMDRLMAERS